MYTDAHIANLAAEELLDRQASARRLIDAGRLTPSRARAELQPFLGLACRLGADVAEIREDIAAIRAPRGAIYGTFVPPSVNCARAMVADDYCLLPEIRTTLAKARDRALDRAAADPARSPRATRLVMLAIAIGDCPPYAEARTDRIAA